ncbi:uncharacterized protein BDW47DRAFT_106130 [Aspergillus candidus]|uniref:Transmembrane protein n=1 Tax=Aspergillus candidus TaxID=41067 RepID=A0A2I2FBE9_ASPCN|nr:hypothetical protein BDW47DRAFT_106130 [Aspergillus candidus]PLB37956.1 hypothetical protein BDW47DRAFT_106130 [Aspergillus candidus]
MGDDLGRGPSLPVGLIVVVYGWVVFSGFLPFQFVGVPTRYMSSFSTGRIGQMVFLGERERKERKRKKIGRGGGGMEEKVGKQTQ